MLVAQLDQSGIESIALSVGSVLARSHLKLLASFALLNSQPGWVHRRGVDQAVVLHSTVWGDQRGYSVTRQYAAK